MNPPAPMRQASRAPSTTPRTVTRRTVVATGLGLLAAGCTTRPSLDDPAPPPPSPTPPPPPPPLPGAEAAAKLLGGLADRAAALSRSEDLPGRTTKILTAVAAGHRAHQVALSAPLPTGRPTGPKPKPGAVSSGKSDEAALAKLVADQKSAVSKLTDRALRSESVTALFWASLAAAAGGYAQALQQRTAPAKAPKPGPHHPVEPVPVSTAIRAMVEQLHAIGYGYQSAIGHLEQDRFELAATALRKHRSLRDRLIAQLVDASDEVPAAAAAYDLPVRPTSPKSAAKLIMTMETALMPFCGQWVAAADTDEDRELAVTTLRSTTLASIGWGGPLLTWPGYVEQ